ncbi:MAG TPA: single-stranded DNA-binding protein [Candidatus Kaiserbacteria bacterium]|nr:single-stranded DNA-binding protein [Candidatus Kaiserbacteria bacterium]
MYINKALVYGNLTRDPELRALPSGQQVATFSLATNRVYKDKEGNKKEVAEFHNIVAFGRPAELISQYMKKGRPIFVEGRLQTRSWESDGRKNYRTEIVVDNFQFGDGGNRGGGSTPSQTQTQPTGEQASQDAPAKGEAIQYPDEDINPEDIPF